MAAVKKLVVCGGSGFLGSRICKFAVARGWDVTSISRSGEPRWDTVTSSASPPPWAHKVTWEHADLLRPTTYSPLLKHADYVVHSMGILLEADYKGVLSGKESPVAGLRKAFAGRPPAPEQHNQQTYEVMNRDSAVQLARAADAENVPAFAYISAAAGAPVLPARYISTKRDAERDIAASFPRMRAVFVRPPFLYDASRPLTMPLAAAVGAGTLLNGITGGLLGGFMGAAGVKPLKADVVAEAVVEALEDETVRGPIEVPRIEELANKAWRKSML